jgi:hypothetical protein
LKPPETIKDPWIPYYIAAGVTIGFTLSIIVAIYLNKKKHKKGYYLFPNGKNYLYFYFSFIYLFIYLFIYSFNLFIIIC